MSASTPLGSRSREEARDKPAKIPERNGRARLAMIDAGYNVVLAMPDGTKPHIGPVSEAAQHFGGDEKAYQRSRTFFDNDGSMNDVRTLRSIIGEGLDNYVGIFVPGGQAPVVDLMQDVELARSCDTSTRTKDRLRFSAMGR